MTKLVTIYSSNIPIDCHILKGRLETEGIHCFLFDENLISAHPFYAVAIGGVKLKIPSDEYAHCQKIIKLLSQDKLIDEAGEYQISDILNNEIDRQNEILSIKSKIRNGSALLDKSVFSNSKFIDSVEIDNKWDVLYLILSLLIWTPFFPIRKKYHCFDCGHDFKKNKKQLTIKHPIQ